MADVRSGPGDPRSRHAESDSTNLLRDLRSLRDATPRESISGARPGQLPRPGSPEYPKFIPVVVLVILTVVGVAAYQVKDPGRAGLSPGPSRSIASVSSQSTAARIAPSTGLPVVDTSRPSSAVSEAAAHARAGGLDHAPLARVFVMAEWVLHYYEPRSPRALSFLRPSPSEVLPVMHCPAYFFGRVQGSGIDEISLVVACLKASTGQGPEDRADHVRTALLSFVAAADKPIDRALALLLTGIPGEAAEVLRPLADSGDANLSTVVSLRAMALSLTGESPDRVEASMERIDSVRSDGVLLTLKAHLAVLQGQNDRACSLLAEVAGKGGGALELYLAAGLAFRLGQWHLVSGLMEKLLSQGSNQGPAYYVLASTQERGGDLVRAKDLYSRAAATMDSDPWLIGAARLRRALLELKSDSVSPTVEEDLKTAESLGVRLPGLPTGLGRHSLKRADLREALVQWERSLTLDGYSDEAVSGLIQCYEGLSDQATCKQGISFFTMLCEQNVVSSGPLRARISEAISTLKEKLRPRPVYEYETR